MSVRPLNPVDPFSDVLVAFSDITEERENFYRLIRRANHDPLTGLPNRAVVLREIAKVLGSTDGRRLRAVLFIDLDDLKSTNDTMGHAENALAGRRFGCRYPGPRGYRCRRGRRRPPTAGCRPGGTCRSTARSPWRIRRWGPGIRWRTGFWRRVHRRRRARQRVTPPR